MMVHTEFSALRSAVVTNYEETIKMANNELAVSQIQGVKFLHIPDNYYIRSSSTRRRSKDLDDFSKSTDAKPRL
ncbi:hypothetical protein QR680_013509 [Steinernema hermaphroditum]|uniref:Uncharacterized protein n=1 Tax=Steinernema hermaphroditum TaxID=289476 RepID=A0AA39M2M8_9BILA|nr:hypothetical protein QR680_013509 [Steinernema hermaphroditum]